MFRRSIDGEITYPVLPNFGLVREEINVVDDFKLDQITLYNDSIYVNYQYIRVGVGYKKIYQVYNIDRTQGIDNTTYFLYEIDQYKSYIQSDSSEIIDNCPPGNYTCYELYKEPLCKSIYDAYCVLDIPTYDIFFQETENGTYAFKVYGGREDFDKFYLKNQSEIEYILNHLPDSASIYKSFISFLKYK